jgi:hypothetical protein
MTDWQRRSLYDQLGTIGTEIGRCISWRKNPKYGNPHESFSRGLTYLLITIDDPKNKGAKRVELCRLKELLIDWYYGDSELYHTTDADWERYFMPYAVASNITRHS